MNRLILAACGVFSLTLQAATYNLYFNNVEQGDNSTAIPGVKVEKPNDESAASSDVETVSTGTGDLATQRALPPSASVAGAPQAAVSQSEWRVGLYGGFAYESAYIGTGDIWTDHDGERYYYDTFGRGTPTAAIGVAYFPMPLLGVHAYVGLGKFWLSGVELEVVPLRYELYEVGLFLGATTLGRNEDNIAALHAGLKLAMNFEEHWQISANGRANLGFVSLDGGLSYRY